jgi:hypothetical protein
VNILAGYVRDVLLKTKPLLVDDDARLSVMRATAKLSRAEKETQLERHVKARKRRIARGFRSRNIVNAEPTFSNYLADFSDAILRIVDLISPALKCFGFVFGTRTSLRPRAFQPSYRRILSSRIS